MKQLLAAAGERDAAVLQHIGVLGELQRQRDILLDQDDGQALARAGGG